jgi:4-amino-4-deoxy-L-arabinose transferase-like glycosyltransferase
MGDERNRLQWIRPTLLLFGIFILALGLRSQIAAIPFERDEGEYAYIAQRWLEGELPYRGSFDQKPPGVFAVYAVCQRLFGESPAAIHWLAQVCGLGTLACVFWLGWRLYSLAAGACAALLCTFLLSDPNVTGQAANTEVFMILPLTVALLAALTARERGSAAWALATGLLCGGAILFKQVAWANTAFIGLYFLVCGGPSRWRLFAAFAIGFALVLLVVAGYFAASGTWEPFYDCVIGFNLKYSGIIPISRYPSAFAQGLGEVLLTAWPIYAVAGATLLGMTAVALRRGWRAVPGADRLLIAWLLFSYAGVATGGYFRDHYFIQALPALALLAGRGIARLGRALAPAAEDGPWPYLVATALVAYGVWNERLYYFPGSPANKSVNVYGDVLFAEAIPVARFIAERSTSSERIFVLGSEPEVYYYARRQAATRYIFMHPLIWPSPDTRERQAVVLEQLSRTPPDWIVTVFVPHSFAIYRQTPLDLFVGVRRLLRDAYEVAGYVRPGPEGAPGNEIVAGAPAVRRWNEQPLWYSSNTPPWTSMVIWRLRTPTGHAPAATSLIRPTE